MKTLLIINPYSKGGKSAKLAAKVIKYLNESSFQFDTGELKNFDDALKFSVEANKAGIENIVALGGDGTINKVINGFFDDDGNRISESKFGVIYTGTSPDFCKSYEIPINIMRASEVIIKRRSKMIPIGIIKLKKDINSDEMITNYFACCTNIGIGASLAKKANSGIRKYFGDFGGTFISLLQLLMKYRGTDYSVKIDGAETYKQNIINISVGITSHIASGLKVKRKNDMQETEMYLLSAANVKLTNVISLLNRVYSGKEFPNSDFLTLDYAKKIEIQNNIVHPDVEFDGDPAGFLPCNIEIARDRLNIIY